MTVAEVRLWGTSVGAVSLPAGERTAAFEYEPSFRASGIELAPLRMPLGGGPYRFAALGEDAFKGLPGMLADSLPDRYGNALIDAWLASEGRTPESFDAVERLCYVGARGMGALEFRPALGPDPAPNDPVDVAALVELAGEVLSRRAELVASFTEPSKRAALRQILRVGSSAGGARPKALIALDPTTEEVRSGQLGLEPRFEHWILKFDGVDDESRDLGTSEGYGAIEWVYSQLAADAGIEMSECRLLEEHGRRHFMTRRFDRSASGDKIHMQSLGGLLHLDFNQPGASSYEQAFLAIRELGLGAVAAEQQFRRMVFNVVARNQDDHVKNIAFLMDRAGNWSLAPAFDVTYAFNPAGAWTAQHQMSINAKRDGFDREDLRAIGRLISLPRGRADRILDEVTGAVRRWPERAREASIEPDRISGIAAAHLLDWS